MNRLAVGQSARAQQAYKFTGPGGFMGYGDLLKSVQ